MQNAHEKFPISEFDLEKELKYDHKKVVALRDEIDRHIQTIKADLRKKIATKDFEELGKVLQAFLASQKVINHMVKS